MIITQRRGFQHYLAVFAVGSCSAQLNWQAGSHFRTGAQALVEKLA
jgi:hypothetical protein